MNTNSNSVVIDLVKLQQQYSNTLTQYNTAVNDYMSYLNTDPSVNFVSIEGQSYNGTGSAGESNATTVEQCQASCANLNGCSGATFISNQCMLRTGDSPLVPATNNSYAIIPQSKQMLLNIEELNQQLIELNQQMLNTITDAQPLYDETNQENSVVSQELQQTYQNLLEERNNIAKLVAQYETLGETEKENNVMITKYYYSYILLLFLAGAIIILLVKISSSSPQQQMGGDSGHNTFGYNVLYVMIIIILIMNIRKYFS